MKITSIFFSILMLISNPLYADIGESNSDTNFKFDSEIINKENDAIIRGKLLDGTFTVSVVYPDKEVILFKKNMMGDPRKLLKKIHIKRFHNIRELVRANEEYLYTIGSNLGIGIVFLRKISRYMSPKYYAASFS